MHRPLLHRNHSSPQVFDAEKYNIMNNQWFCAYYYRINLIEMVSVIEFTRIYHHAVMQTLLNFVKIYYRQSETSRRLDLSGTLIVGRCRLLALVADPPEYTILGGGATNISCKDVTQT